MRFHARVHIILARAAETAVVIRRGPSKEVCTLLWDRRIDTFTLGQWFRGRIYERRCDLSPDGKHFIYFAFKGKDNPVTKESWTAISRTPYLKALGLWPIGGAWNGGGLFMDNERYWLNTIWYQDVKALLEPSDLTRSMDRPFPKSYGGECPGVYYIRLQRDGWTFARTTDHLDVFEKPLPDGWILRKTAHATSEHPAGKGCYYDTHSLHHASRGIHLDCPEWEWADWDRHRLVFIKQGILFTSDSVFNATKDGIGNHGTDQILFDFNPLHFAAHPAPY